MTINLDEYCSHWKDPIKIGDYSVRLSAWLDRPGWLTASDRMIGRGTYLDITWEHYLKREGDFTIMDWPDKGVISILQLHSAIISLLHIMREGKAPEIACIGGHGRTGTLTACLIVYVENLPPRQAIEAVWDRYCESAIETFTQMKLIYRYWKFLKGSNPLT